MQPHIGSAIGRMGRAASATAPPTRARQCDEALCSGVEHCCAVERCELRDVCVMPGARVYPAMADDNHVLSFAVVMLCHAVVCYALDAKQYSNGVDAARC